MTIISSFNLKIKIICNFIFSLLELSLDIVYDIKLKFYTKFYDEELLIIICKKNLSIYL